MKFLNSRAAMVAVGVFAAGAVLWFLSRRVSGAVGDAASAVGSAVNPINPDNIFARGVDAVGDVLDDGSDDDSFSLGSWLFDLFNPEFDPNAPVVSDDQELQLIQWDQLPQRRGPI